MLITLLAIDDISAFLLITDTADKSVPIEDINSITLVPANASASVGWTPNSLEIAFSMDV